MKNPKRFWKFNWNGPHKIRIVRVNRFGLHEWARYNCEFACERCGVSFGSHVIDECQMVQFQFDVKKLHAVHGHSSVKAEDLRG